MVVAIACAGDPKPPPPMIVPPARRERVAATTHIDLSSLRRLVQHFDFEDPERFPRELPQHWYRILSKDSGRPGYPDFGDIRLVDSLAREGKWSLAFECRGGSMAAALPPGVVRIFGGSQYRLSCWMRTEGLRNAGGRLVARFHGADGRPIGVEVATDAIRSEDRWTQLLLDLDDIPPDAAELALELEVVQPSALHPDASRPIGDDIAATVWFDDLEIWQVPSIRFSTDRPGQLFRVDETPAVAIELRDIVSERLSAHIAVEDIDGRPLVAERLGVAAVGEPLVVQLPALRRPGWYRATLVVEGDGAVIARRELDLSVVDAAPPRRGEGPRLGLDLPDIGRLGDRLATALVDRLGASFVLVPLWAGGYEAAATTATIEGLRPFVDRLLDRRIEPILVIPSVPESLATLRHLDPWQALAFFDSDDAQARDLLEPWLLTFGQHVERWQIGALGSPAARDPFDPARGVRLRRFLESLVADPTLLVPADADRDPVPSESGIAANLLTPWMLRGDGSPSFASLFAESFSAADAVVTIEPLPESDFAPRARVDDLAIRTIDAWRNGAMRLALPLPIRFGELGGERLDSLRPEALAWRQLGRALGGRRFAGEIPLGGGARLWIARGERDAVLVGWTESGPRDISLVLSAGSLTRVDLLGDAIAIERIGGVHRIGLDGSPIILEGVDPRIAELLASVRFDPQIIESRRTPQRTNVVFRNPTAGPLNGVLTVPDRLDWDISPRRQNVVGSILGDLRVPLDVTLPRSVTQGETMLSIDFEPAGGDLPPLKLVAPIAVDWPEVQIDRSWRFIRSVETGGVDVAVTVSVTNRSERPLDLEAFALARDFPQNRRPILRLGPGQTASRTFQFADGARRLSGGAVLTGVSELEGDRRLTLELAIPSILPPPASASRAASDPDR